MKDLSSSDEDLEGCIESININGDKTFYNNTKYPKDAEIIIYYHSLKLLSPPLSAKAAKGDNYSSVKTQFEEAGFTKIKIEVEYDLILGWFKKDREVESVTINSNSKFSEKDEFRPDAEIIITYHTFKKNAK